MASDNYVYVYADNKLQILNKHTLKVIKTHEETDENI